MAGCVPERPSLADAASWGEAAAQALGWEPGTFLTAHNPNRKSASLVFACSDRMDS